MAITSARLEKDVMILIDWVNTLANSADREFGYDGLKVKHFQEKQRRRLPLILLRTHSLLPILLGRGYDLFECVSTGLLTYLPQESE